MGKIAKGVNKINFAMLYGNYCYIIIENFPQKFSSCREYIEVEDSVGPPKLAVFTNLGSTEICIGSNFVT